MPKRSSKPRDLNQLAARIVQATTTERGEDESVVDGRHSAAVELGRLGGLKGGRARAQKLSAEERSAIARRAAIARWTRRPTES